MFKISICDDDKRYLARAEETIAAYLDTIQVQNQIYSFEGPNAFLEAMKRNECYNLVFMDTDMKPKNGLQMASLVNRVMPQCSICYLSDDLRYAKDVFDTDCAYFIMKEELEKRLPHLFIKLEKDMRKRGKRMVFINERGSEVCIREKDIYYIERQARYSKVHTSNAVLTTRESLSSLSQKLNQQEFLRCHNSFIVRLGAVYRYKRTEFVMPDEEHIPVSRGYNSQVREAFMVWATRELQLQGQMQMRA